MSNQEKLGEGVGQVRGFDLTLEDPYQMPTRRPDFQVMQVRVVDGRKQFRLSDADQWRDCGELTEQEQEIVDGLHDGQWHLSPRYDP